MPGVEQCVASMCVCVHMAYSKNGFRNISWLNIGFSVHVVHVVCHPRRWLETTMASCISVCDDSASVINEDQDINGSDDDEGELPVEIAVSYTHLTLPTNREV